MTDSKPGPVIPAVYAAALGDEDPILVMATTPDRLRRVVQGLTEKQLSTRPLPGKWSIKEIVAHLADGEVVLGARYRFIAAHERPAIAGYDQDAFVAMLGVGNAAAADLVDDFALARAVNLGLIERLPTESLERVGIHGERGEESILQMIHMYAGHDLHHLRQVETLRVGLFGAPKKARRPARKVAKKSKPAAKPPAKKAPAKKTVKVAAKPAKKSRKR